MATSGSNYEMYRATTVGVALIEVLDQYVQDGQISAQLRNKMLSTFDRNINAALRDMTKHKVHFFGEKLVAYRFCDNVWTFIMKNVQFSDHTRTCDNIECLERIKFVACDGRASTELSRRTGIL